MADRVSVSITIGGDLAAGDRDQLVDLINDQGPSVEWTAPNSTLRYCRTTLRYCRTKLR